MSTTRKVTAEDLAVGLVYAWPMGERRIVAIETDRGLVNFVWRSTDPDSDTTSEFNNTLPIAQFLEDVNRRPRSAEVAAFSPGPWWVHARYGTICRGDPVNVSAECVAVVHTEDPRARRANSFLIAAAPALHAIAEGVLSALSYPRGSEAQVRCLEEVGQDARRILSKVGGAA